MRIAFTGAPNVGKTTLFNALKKELADYHFYPELAIDLINKNPKLFNQKLEFEKVLYGLHRQRELSDNFRNKKNIIADRCILDISVYSKYFKIAEHFNDSQIVDELSASKYDTIFIVCPFNSELSKEKAGLHNAFAEKANELSEKGFPFVFIEEKDFKNRVNMVLSYVKQGEFL